MNSFPPRSELVLSEESFRSHMTEELGVTDDTIALDFPTAVFCMAAALGERKRGIIPVTDSRRFATRHDALLRQDTLPAHLQDIAAFRRRYSELTGLARPSFDVGEIATTVAENRTRPSVDRQRRFEHATAHLFSACANILFKANPTIRNLMISNCPVSFTRKRTDVLVHTGDGLYAALPKDHAGIIQCAPDMNDVFGRGHELSTAVLGSVVMLSSTPFSEELTRTIAQETFGVTQDRIHTASDGFAKGAAALRQEMRRSETYRPGFGAMVLSATHNYPMDEIRDAITAARDLLAPGGLLLISDLETFPDGQGSVWEMIGHAREVFGQPQQLGVMTAEDDIEGRQAVFVK